MKLNMESTALQWRIGQIGHWPIPKRAKVRCDTAFVEHYGLAMKPSPKVIAISKNLEDQWLPKSNRIKSITSMFYFSMGFSKW